MCAGSVRSFVRLQQTQVAVAVESRLTEDMYMRASSETAEVGPRKADNRKRPNSKVHSLRLPTCIRSSSNQQEASCWLAAAAFKCCGRVDLSHHIISTAGSQTISDVTVTHPSPLAPLTVLLLSLVSSTCF